ncbi:amidase [Bradyrhizobium manausense]
MALAQTIRAKVEHCLENAANPRGEGSNTFTRIYADQARLTADYFDQALALGIELPPLAGMIISIKDLFDVTGEVTRAGSRARTGEEPAPRDAEIVRRLRGAGAIIVGRTTMTEFAFSGLGLNPHFGTPANPWERDQRRIPGGSSSGAAISVTDRMAEAAIGTDTGGSVRIPAALCGLVGFKPTARTVPLQGTLPLSPSFDSIGPLAPSVGECARLYGVLSGQNLSPQSPSMRHPATFMVLKNQVLEGLDAQVARTYERTLNLLSNSGFKLVERHSSAVAHLAEIMQDGGIVAAEAFEWHEKLLERKGAAYDPRVRSRIERGAHHRAADHIRRLQLRTRLISEWERELAGFDAVLAPTVPTIAPRIGEIETSDEAYSRANLLMLRNTTIVNALDGCAITLPCQEPTTAPVGLMLIGGSRGDWPLLSLAAGVETRINAVRFTGG